MAISNCLFSPTSKNPSEFSICDYLITFRLKHATNPIQNRCKKFEK